MDNKIRLSNFLQNALHNNLRIGFVFILEYSESRLNNAISKAILNLIDKLIIVVPTEAMTQEFKRSIEKEAEKPSLVQLRKYITVLTPSTLVEKSGVSGTKGRDESNVKSTAEVL